MQIHMNWFKLNGWLKKYVIGTDWTITLYYKILIISCSVVLGPVVACCAPKCSFCKHCQNEFYLSPDCVGHKAENVAQYISLVWL